MVRPRFLWSGFIRIAWNSLEILSHEVTYEINNDWDFKNRYLSEYNFKLTMTICPPEDIVGMDAIWMILLEPSAPWITRLAPFWLLELLLCCCCCWDVCWDCCWLVDVVSCWMFWNGTLYDIPLESGKNSQTKLFKTTQATTSLSGFSWWKYI